MLSLLRDLLEGIWLLLGLAVEAVRANAKLLALCLLIFTLYYTTCGLITIPWMFSWPGHPSLTGSWVGVLNSKQGAEYPVLLELEGQPLGDLPNLVGRVWVCTRGGGEYRFDMSGDANRDGSKLHLDTKQLQGRILAHGFAMGGSWQGETLRLSASNPFNSEGDLWSAEEWIAARPTHDDNFPATVLSKGSTSDYHAACQSVRVRGSAD